MPWADFLARYDRPEVRKVFRGFRHQAAAVSYVRERDGQVREVSAAEIAARDLKFIDLTAAIPGAPKKEKQAWPDAIKPKRAAVAALLTESEYD